MRRRVRGPRRGGWTAALLALLWIGPSPAPPAVGAEPDPSPAREKPASPPAREKPASPPAREKPASPPSAVEGVLDLRGWSFGADGAVQLRGDWGFCPGLLLAPGEAAPGPTACGTVRVPGLWTESGAAPGRGVATYRLRILLPPDPPPLALRAGAPLTAHRLYVDGRRLPGTGRVSTTAAEHRSELRNRIHPLPEPEGALDLVVQVANHDFRSGGLRRRWILGSQDDVWSWAAAFTLRDTFLATVYLLVGLFFLGFFANRPQERTRLYFGLACVALALRVVPANYSDIGQILAPGMGFSTSLRLEYFANNFMVFAGAGYFAHKVPRDMPRALVRLLQAGSLAAMVAALVLPLSWAQVPMRTAYVLGAVMLATAILALARAARRGEPDVRITLVAVPLCLGVVLWDSLQAEQGMGPSLGLLPRSRAWTVLTEAVALFPTTLVAMILVEAVVLMRAFSRSYRTIETLSKDLMTSNRELRETHRAVIRFVPFDFLRLLGKRSIREVARGDCLEAEMGILFCDIRSFTARAESMTPHEAFRFVNAFTECMEGPIHEQGGFINEYLGDCILALFPGGSEPAVRAGIGMLEALDRFNRAAGAEAAGGGPVRIGIGVHTGPVMLGTIGGSDRLAHTVIGDAVNVASRVESLTRLYGAELLISGSTREGLAEASGCPLRLLDRVVLKGTSQPIAIWEVLVDGGDRGRAGRLATRDRFEQARRAYEERAFDRAGRLFGECLVRVPDDLASELYVGRCRRLAEEGVAPDWRGETVLTEK